MNSFILMHQNRPVADVSIQFDDDGAGFLHVNQVFDWYALPYGVKNTTEYDIDRAFTDWNDSRCLPLGRPNLQQILNTINIHCASELLPLSYMCSLTDCYWYKTPDSSVAWEDVNFRENGFSSNLYKHLFFDDKNEPINNWNSPDLTTDGALPKTWIQKDGDFYLLKSSKGQVPMDVYNEIIANAIFDQLGIEHVEYRLERLEQFNASSCKCFIDVNESEFVPVASLLTDEYYTSTADYLETMKSFGYQKDINAMILGDMLIGNVDRHARNYGQIIDWETQNIVKLAPIFDHGGCDLIHDISHRKYAPTGLTFEQTLQLLDKGTLALAEKIDMRAISELIESLPIEESNKTTILRTLNTRIDKAIELVRGAEYDLGREQ